MWTSEIHDISTGYNISGSYLILHRIRHLWRPKMIYQPEYPAAGECMAQHSGTQSSGARLSATPPFRSLYGGQATILVRMSWFALDHWLRRALRNFRSQHNRGKQSRCPYSWEDGARSRATKCYYTITGASRNTGLCSRPRRLPHPQTAP